jgi:hypothetical protein
MSSGSGHQAEILKKLYPGITIICFDLPAQLYLCEKYLTQIFGPDEIVSSTETLKWKDMLNVQKGKIHFIGNWQIPIVQDFKFDVFWSAASFGEMEPKIVENYINIISHSAKWVYLLQARHGKELTGKNKVLNATTFDDYKRFLKEYELVGEQDAFSALKRMSQSGGYFEAVWKKT